MIKPIPNLIRTLESTLALNPEDYDQYGNFAIKLRSSWLNDHSLSASPSQESSALVLVTGITPTPTGEGKTTTAIALTDALQFYTSSSLCLRQASLGPFFGVKGGATGGGLADLAFPHKTNLHFTGDFHAISSAHNFVSALLDNHLYQSNLYQFDLQRILWKRTVDMNDRSLRQIQIGRGAGNGPERSEGFVIVAASEIMATLCLSKNHNDLLKRLQALALGFSNSGSLIQLSAFRADEALSLLLEDALRPNLTLTRQGSPCFIHGGPFANIAHGCNSVLATHSALKLSKIVVTEAGFGSDLGVEKFLNIKAPVLGHKPKVVVLVASLKALKFHGGRTKVEAQHNDLMALQHGLLNLDYHIHLLRKVYGFSIVVSINVFRSDSEEELLHLEHHLTELNVLHSRCEGFLKGAEGARDLAEKVLKLTEDPPNIAQPPIYHLEDSITEKLKKLSLKVHGATSIQFSDQATQDLEMLTPHAKNLPICLAKTPFSFTSDPKKGGLPQEHELVVQRLIPALAAGFLIAIAGDILLMPGLPKVPRGTEPPLNF